MCSQFFFDFFYLRLTIHRPLRGTQRVFEDIWRCAEMYTICCNVPYSTHFSLLLLLTSLQSHSHLLCCESVHTVLHETQKHEQAGHTLKASHCKKHTALKQATSIPFVTRCRYTAGSGANDCKLTVSWHDDNALDRNSDSHTEGVKAASCNRLTCKALKFKISCELRSLSFREKAVHKSTDMCRECAKAA